MLRRLIPQLSRITHIPNPFSSPRQQFILTSIRSNSSSSPASSPHDVTSTSTSSPAAQGQQQQQQTQKKKTMAQLDEELKLKMSGIAGDGGEAGVEYEDGKPVAMKRSVKDNMFRYI